MIDIVTECMMPTSICESSMSWYAYALRKMLEEPIPMGQESPREFENKPCAYVFGSEGCL